MTSTGRSTWTSRWRTIIRIECRCAGPQGARAAGASVARARRRRELRPVSRPSTDRPAHVWRSPMEQRLSVVTLGTTDLRRARAFYESLGWRSRAAPDDDVVFFQVGGSVLSLWDRERLAEDSGVALGSRFGGGTLPPNVAPDVAGAETIPPAGGAGG